MELIKLYRGNNDSVMALYMDFHGFYVTETGSGWDNVKIASRQAISIDEAIAYTDDIAHHCPLCYQADDINKRPALESPDLTLHFCSVECRSVVRDLFHNAARSVTESFSLDYATEAQCHKCGAELSY